MGESVWKWVKVNKTMRALRARARAYGAYARPHAARLISTGHPPPRPRAVGSNARPRLRFNSDGKRTRGLDIAVESGEATVRPAAAPPIFGPMPAMGNDTHDKSSSLRRPGIALNGTASDRAIWTEPYGTCLVFLCPRDVF